MNWIIGRMTSLFLGLKEDIRGQGLTEYVMILVLVSIIAILIMIGLGGSVNNKYSEINSALPM